MAILIDTPYWPAHGTVWAHLVSDTDLAELHAFAAACGVPRRSFDLDHYDVPVERHAQLVAAGARHVEGHELIRRLRASGLRVRAADRPLRAELARRWAQLLPAVPETGEELAARWSEPHRVYHAPSHLRDTLDRLDLLAAAGEPVGRSVRLAAWCHDAVHTGTSPADEHASAALAGELLGPVLEPEEVAEVVRLVRLTARHDPAAEDVAGQLLCDADLGVLGGTETEYRSYTRQVRAEYAHVPEADFRRGRATVLRQLVEREAIFRTPSGARRWEAAARRNLSAELGSLDARD